jgi:alkanesulfonate monooxygenase SsuD/methylene tetrahydromethanopterin reductase-like flavin-dependent oxidoreductase (luciferase family)
MPVAGLSVVPYTDSLPRLRELVQVADDGGLELVGIQDHPYEGRFLDTFSLIATLLAETRRLSFFTDVANLPLRPPAVLAKAAASLDVIAAGASNSASAPAASPTRSPASADPVAVPAVRRRA